MDDLEHTAIGKSIGGFKIARYIDRGASALVFEAMSSDGIKLALKVLDPEFIKRRGDDIEIKRIERQLQLKGKHHEHLIDILGGGTCNETGLHYLAMPYQPAPSLNKTLDKIPRENIGLIVSQIASAASFLENEQICHRDIKPANLVVTGNNFDHAILLDLGVLKPLGMRDHLTDSPEAQDFVGSTRYSPPEFLLREENQSTEGYRAVTFYQIGAVLHDLIMRRPLFHQVHKPPARLIRAVLLEEPVIDATDVPPELIRLARLCLMKNPDRRLQSLDWSSFSPRGPHLPSVAEARRRAEKLRGAIASRPTTIPDTNEKAKLDSLFAHLRETVKQTCLEDTDTFPPAGVAEHARASRSTIITVNIGASSRHGLSRPLIVILKVQLTDTSAFAFALHVAAGILVSDCFVDVSSVPYRSLGEAILPEELPAACVSAVYSSLVNALEEAAAGLKSDADKWIEIGGSRC